MRGLFGAPSGSIDAWHFIGEFRFRVFRAFSGILSVRLGFGYFGHFRGFGSRRGVSRDPTGTTNGDTFGGSWPRQPPGAAPAGDPMRVMADCYCRCYCSLQRRQRCSQGNEKIRAFRRSKSQQNPAKPQDFATTAVMLTPQCPHHGHPEVSAQGGSEGSGPPLPRRAAPR